MDDGYTAPAPPATSYDFYSEWDGTKFWPGGIVGFGPLHGPYLTVDVISGQGLPVQPDAGAVFHVIVDSGSVTPAGGATAAKQDAEIASLASIDGKLPALVGGAVPVAVPVGVSTSAKQDTGNISLASIDGKISVVNTGAVVVASGSITASIAAAQTIAVTNSGTFAVQVSSALPAGSAIIGKVGIDQTTPGTTNAVAPTAATTGGASMYHLPSSANTTNATNVKNAAGTVYGLEAFNTSSATKYLKLYDKSSAPSVGSDTPVKTIAIPPTSGGALGGVVRSYPAGLAFAAGISYALTGLPADNDTTALASGDVVGLGIDYK